MPSSSSPSPERGEASCSAADHSEQDGRSNNATAFTPASSFFIIHETSSSLIVPNGGTTSPPKLRRKADPQEPPRLYRTGKGRVQKKKKARSKTPSSAPSLQSSGSLNSASPALRASSSTVLEGHEGDGEEASSPAQVANESTATKRTPELSILSRCGSAPDLPMNSPLSASVYSSSKKRTLQCTNGASPHLATLQRSRLTPLPANTRPAAVQPDPLLDDVQAPKHSSLGELDATPMYSKELLLQEKMRQDAQTISSLKQRLVLLEREVSAGTKFRHAADKQIAQLSRDNQRLQSEKTTQSTRIDELDKTVLRQRHEYDKLAARYAAVYANLQKLVDQQQNPSDNSAQQSALQALARENQDFLRKLRVLEARHAEDKTLTSNQEKKIKRLRAEIEALQHMQEAKSREDDLDESASDTDQVSRLGKPKKRMDADSNYGGRPGSASSSVSMTSSTPRRAGSSARAQVAQASALGNASHLVSSEAYQYIDPNILKVLEKVDSQFSITNAINLSVVLKKWLNSCVHIVCSTHLPTVLQTLLKRICELLHCEHAALFTVDHATRKLMATCSERGPERWELPLDKGIAGYAARHNKLCNVHCANDDPRFYSSTDSITGTTSREVLALPIVHDLQSYLETQLPSGGDSNRPKTNNLGVFAVLKVWNTSHQKPFSANDQIMGCLLAVQAGTILRQTAVTRTLQKLNHKMHQILQMPSEIVSKASTGLHSIKPQASEDAERPSSPAVPTLVNLVDSAQKELGECLGVKHLRVFVFDAAVHKFWHVGKHFPQDADDGSSPTTVRRYVSAQSSLCALLLRSDAAAIVLTEPAAEAAFNDTVDIPGGARGLYLVPIPSPWSNGALPLGVLQVPRVAKARLSASPFALTASESTGNGIAPGSAAEAAVSSERQAAQQTEDRLMLELLALFGRVFAGLLHHVAAQQLYETCPLELRQAQIATLTDRLDAVAAGSHKEEESEEHDDAPTKAGAEDVPQADRNLSGRRTSITVVHSKPPPPKAQHVQRAASADPKHRAAQPSRRVSSSPTRAASTNESAVIPDGTNLRQGPHQLHEDGSDTPPTQTEATDDAAGGSEGVSAGLTEDEGSSTLESEAKEHEQLAPSGQEHEETEQGPWLPGCDAMQQLDPADTPAFGWTAAALDDEQCAGEGGEEYTLEGGGAYDPSTWSAAEYAGPYEEGLAWEYGVVGDAAALTNQDDDAASNTKGANHLSTDSSYAIDLHLSSRNTSSAEPDEPSGAL